MGLFNFLKKTSAKELISPESLDTVSTVPLNIREEIKPSIVKDSTTQSQNDDVKSSTHVSDCSSIELEKRYERKLSSFKFDTIKLVGCTSSDKQFAIGYAKKNDFLSIKKVYEKNGYAFKVFDFYGEEIGKIPAKFEECCRMHKIIAVFFDDAFWGKSSYYPIIKVFWDIPKCADSPVFRISSSKSKPTLNNKKPYVILDFETTGLQSFKDEIIEVGMIKIKNGEIIDQYSTLINPCIHIPNAASEVNGIYDKDVASAPKISDVIHIINEFIGESVVIGHNIRFDLDFLKMAMLENGISKNVTYFDTLSFSKAILPNTKNHKLQTLMEIAGIESTQSHRALDDAINTYKVLKFLINEKANSISK